MKGDESRHEFGEHTAELVLRLSAARPGELFAEACRALGTLLCEEVGCEQDGDRVVRTVVVEAVDADALLVDLLNELIYIGETERWAPSVVNVVEWMPRRTVVEVVGAFLQGAPSRIKSATHHGLTLRRIGRRWEAEVIFDV